MGQQDLEPKDEWRERVYLGTYSKNAEDACNVQMSNRTSGTGYVIADAIKIFRT